MPHVDEGTINALLDGELDAAEVGEVESHFATCAACASRFQEARRFATEAEQLVGVLQAPPDRRNAAGGAAPAPGRPAGAAPPPPPPRPPFVVPPPPGDPERSALEPIVLMPMPEPRIATRRRSGVRWIGWAAMLFVALGAGIIAQQVRRQDSELSRVAPLEEYAVSPRETSVPADTGASAPAAASRAGAADPETAAPLAAAPRPPAAKLDDAAKAAAPEPPPTTEGLVLRDEAAGQQLSTRESSEPAPASAPAPARTAPPQDTGYAGETQAEVDRRRAAAAMATLDLDKRRAEQQSASRTNAARQSRTTAAEPPPAASPPTISDRARTYLRIGLDEAARQLGSPLHVIEGMRPEYIGLALGQQSPGADTARPVVRVVYSDPDGRLVLLDQQRIRRGPDGPRPALDGLGGTRMVRRDVWLSLSGEVGASELRGYADRVR